MIVDLDTIGQAGEDPTVLRFAEPVDSGAEVLFRDPVQGEIRLTRTGTTVWLDGAVATTVTLACARCLRPVVHRLVGRFREGFRPGAPESGGRDGGTEGAALEGTTLDVTEVVRQHLILALPMAPLCRPGCRGLCPICGADRNEVACACTPDASDPRLAPFREFRPPP